MTTAIDRAIQFAAGLLGAAGVAAAAGGAHGAAYPNLPTLAFILLVHATAVLALGAREHRSLPVYRIAAGVMLLGMLLFGGDLALRDLAGTRLFPLAAPIGGSTLILAWILAALAALRR